jgi:hypothetical protein
MLNWECPYAPMLVQLNMCTKCRNSSLGLVTKARACKGASQKWNLKVTFHVLRRLRVQESERMNIHIPKWAPILGVGISNLQRTIVKVKTHWMGEFLISLESSWNINVKSGLAWLTRSQVTGWNPLEGSTKSSCGKLRLGGTLPASNSRKG